MFVPRIPVGSGVHLHPLALMAAQGCRLGQGWESWTGPGRTGAAHRAGRRGVSERIAIVWPVVAMIAVLHTFALVAQVGGGILLVVEAIRTRRNISTFQDALVEAEGVREEQRSTISADREKTLSRLHAQVAGVPRSAMLPTGFQSLLDAYTQFTSPDTVEKLVSDHGPAAAIERRALLSFLDSQFPATPRRSHGPWPGVFLLSQESWGPTWPTCCRPWRSNVRTAETRALELAL